MDTSEHLEGPVSRQGHVTEFDAHRGLGRIESDNGEGFMFHCVELVDGSRMIEVGTEVEFAVREKFSRPEAFAVRRR